MKFWKHRARDRDSERRKLLNRDSKWNCVLFYYVNTLCFFVFFMYGQKGVKPDIRPGPLSRFRPTTQGRSMPHSQPLRPIPYPPSPASPCLPPRADTRHPPWVARPMTARPFPIRRPPSPYACPIQPKPPSGEGSSLHPSSPTPQVLAWKPSSLARCCLLSSPARGRPPPGEESPRSNPPTDRQGARFSPYLSATIPP